MSELANTAPPQKKDKTFNPYIISKRTPTQFSPQVTSIVHEQTDCVYVASGNLVNVYSLTTNLLIGTYRSKRQQASQEQTKGDVHRGIIVTMSLVKDRLITLCSKGVLAEWDVLKNTQSSLNGVFELQSLGKIKLAYINDENIALYDQDQQVFKLYETQSKSLKLTLPEYKECQGYVNAFALQNNTLAYIKGRNLIIHDVLEKNGGKAKIIQRDTLLRAVAINDNSSLIALADDYGKIYIIHYSGKQTVVQTLHWHAHRVSALTFIHNTPYLLSGGEEAVIVQWHLETQSKQFISRLGAPIKNIGLSSPNQLYYSVSMSDNSVKVIRFDNNKTKVHVASLQLDRQCLPHAEPVFYNAHLLMPHQNSLQLYHVDDRTLHSMQVKPQNFVSAMNGESHPQTQVKSFCITPDRRHLVTYEELLDCNSHKDIRVHAVKFWSRDVVQEGFQGFEVKWIVQDPCNNDEGIQLHAVDNKQIVIVNGSQVQVWRYSKTESRWTIQTEVNYQGLNVVQALSNIRYRIGQESSIIRCIVLLHENGVLSFWDQECLSFVYTFRLNSPSKKVVFEESMRYLASLTVNGGVEVWKVKGKEEKHWWDLNFKSIKDIIEYPCRENQFIITMNSADEHDGLTDSILLFQYSRPQNLIMYWKSQLPFLKAVFCQQEVETSSYLLLINKNLELQKIYFGVTRDSLKAIAHKRRMSMDLKLRETEQAKDSERKADYKFIEKKTEDSQHTGLKTLLSLQEAQIKRLDKVDKLLSDGETQGPGSFLGMASLDFYFDQFAQEMLTKPSKATNLLDLQVELQTSRRQDDDEMEENDTAGQGGQEKKEMYGQIAEEVARAFEMMFK